MGNASKICNFCDPKSLYEVQIDKGMENDNIRILNKDKNTRNNFNISNSKGIMFTNDEYPKHINILIRDNEIKKENDYFKQNKSIDYERKIIKSEEELNNILKKKELEEKEKILDEQIEKLNKEEEKIKLLKKDLEQKNKILEDQIEKQKKQYMENLNEKEEILKFKEEEEIKINEKNILLKNEEKDLDKKKQEISQKGKLINKNLEELAFLKRKNEENEKILKEQIEKNKQVEIMNKENEKFLEQKEKELSNKDKELNKKEKEYEKKLKEIELLKSEYERKEKELIEKHEKEIKLYYNKKEDETKEKETSLKQREKDIIDKTNLLNKKQEEINNKLEETYLIKTQYEKKLKELNEKIENIKQEESLLKQKEKNLIEKEKYIERENQIITQKINELTKLQEKINTREIQLKNGENLLNKKFKELELKIKKSEEDILLQKNKLLSWENSLKMQEEEFLNRDKPITIGLNNIGATCYMNATLQCLSNSKKLTEYFLKIYKSNPNKKMANEYQIVVFNLWKRENNNKSYSPNSFKEVLSNENPLFKGIAANDSKDLINFLLERFHQELNVMKININNNINNGMINQEDQTNEQSMLGIFLEEFKEKFNSPISNLFYGIAETKSQCIGCSIIKYNFQVYSFLEFPLQQVNSFFASLGKKPLFTNDGKNPDVDLYECFEYNRKIDLMSGDNQMYCNICNKLSDSYYSTLIYSSPIYLIINLNRGRGATYECKVNFPEQLNLFNYVTFKSGYTAYGLYAVICHLGPSSMSGHFVAYCRNRINNKWYLYNDAMVTPCSRPQQYNDGMPYILFYRALTLD